MKRTLGILVILAAGVGTAAAQGGGRFYNPQTGETFIYTPDIINPDGSINGLNAPNNNYAPSPPPLSSYRYRCPNGTDSALNIGCQNQ